VGIGATFRKSEPVKKSSLEMAPNKSEGGETVAVCSLRSWIHGLQVVSETGPEHFHLHFGQAAQVELT
jgi:hypothetical protein